MRALPLLMLFGSTSICAMLQSAASSSSVLPPTSRKRTRDAGSSLLVSAVRVVGSSLCTGVLPSLGEESTSDSDEERDTESGCSSDEEGSNSIILAAGACALGAIYTLYLPKLKIPQFRCPNVHRDRSRALEFVRSWDDVMFYRQFRLKRIDFYNLLRLILTQIEGNDEMARRSSGSSVSPELRLCMTCRILAGARHLDMIWYQVHVDHLWDYISPVLQAIQSKVDNVRLPLCEVDINAHAQEWGEIQFRKLGCKPTPNLNICAVVRLQKLAHGKPALLVPIRLACRPLEVDDLAVLPRVALAVAVTHAQPLDLVAELEPHRVIRALLYRQKSIKSAW